MGEFKFWDLANTAWAFAMANQADALVFTALARATRQHIGEHMQQVLASTAWAYAKTNQMDVLWLATLARAAEQRMGKLRLRISPTRLGHLR